MKRAVVTLMLMSVCLLPQDARGESQSQYWWVPLDCWNGSPGMMPCGENPHEGNLACSTDLGHWDYDCGFEDPLPEGSKVIGVTAYVYLWQCGSWCPMAGVLNGLCIGPCETMLPINYSCGDSMPCLTQTYRQSPWPEFAYNYGPHAKNEFRLDFMGQWIEICVEHVVLLLEYLPPECDHVITIGWPIPMHDFDLSEEDYTATPPVEFRAQAVTRRLEAKKMLRLSQVCMAMHRSEVTLAQ